MAVGKWTFGWWAFAVVVVSAVLLLRASGIGATPSAAIAGSGRIAFERGTATGLDIYAMAPDGTGQQAVTENPAPELSPAWSPGGAIAFVSGETGRFEIYSIRSDGSDLRQLTSRAPVGARELAWSPDGRRIAFIAGPIGRGDIYLLTVGAKRAVNITNSATDEVSPAWAPDSKRLVFAGNSGGVYRLYTLAVGSRPKPLTRGPGADVDASWSPNGKLIAFTRSDPQGNVDIYTISVLGTRETRLTTDPAQDFAPAWSPDSQLIAFVSSRNVQADDVNYEIYTMSVTGKGQVNRSNNAAPDLAPSWSSAKVPQLAVTRVAAGATVTCSDGTSGDDDLNGNQYGETICGKQGNDKIHGNDGKDSIYGGDGIDLVHGDGYSDPVVAGGSGEDRPRKSNEPVSRPSGGIYGDGGGDTLYAYDGKADRVDGGTGTTDVVAAYDTDKDVVVNIP